MGTIPTSKSSLVPTRQLFDSPTKLVDGIACENSFQCKSNVCLEICMRKKVKASCVKNKECLSDRCRSKNKDKTKKRCTLPLKEAGVSTSPTTMPTSKSSLAPTRQPSNIPSISLSLLPSVQSSVIPSTSPTTIPTSKSSLVPTRQLFDSPTKLVDGIACENSFQCKSNFCLEICMRKKVKASCVKKKINQKKKDVDRLP